MKFETVFPIIENVPYMKRSQGKLIYELILDNDIHDILELGIAHGTGSCYMAAALDEKKKGKIVTIDHHNALTLEPNVFELIEKCNLKEYVKPVIASRSYNWELLKLIEQQTKDGVCEPIFDFCYLDGAHDFEPDCCAFFLVDKLLKPGGLILFDDLDWTFSNCRNLKDTEMVQSMADDEKSTPHIRKLVDLIVLTHPNYEQPSVLNEWFLIRKKGASQASSNLKLSQYTNVFSFYEIKKSVRKVIRKRKNKRKSA